MEDHSQLGLSIASPINDGKALRLKVEWRGLGKALSKGLLSLKFGQFASTLGSLIDAADTIREKPGDPLTPEQQGWLWLHRGTLAALAWTIRSSPHLTDRLGNSDEEIEAFLQGAQAEEEVFVGPSFFVRPASSEFFGRVKAGLEGWLQFLDADVGEQERIGRRLMQEFPIALDLELRQRRSDYATLELFFQPTLVSPEAER